LLRAYSPWPSNPQRWQVWRVKDFEDTRIGEYVNRREATKLIQKLAFE
jgi:hypothetical protein